MHFSYDSSNAFMFRVTVGSVEGPETHR